MVNAYLNFECLYIHPFLFVHNHCERADGPIGMNLALALGVGVARLNFELLYFFVYLSIYLSLIFLFLQNHWD